MTSSDRSVQLISMNKKTTLLAVNSGFYHFIQVASKFLHQKMFLSGKRVSEMEGMHTAHAPDDRINSCTIWNVTLNDAESICHRGAHLSCTVACGARHDHLLY